MWPQRPSSLWKTLDEDDSWPLPELPMGRLDEIFGMVDRLSDIHRRLKGFSSGDDCVPATDIYSSSKGVLMHVDLPGVAKENVGVDVQGNMMTITGNRTALRDPPSDVPLFYQSLQRCRGTFKKEIHLPKGITDANKDKITADFKDGTLEIFVPRDEKPKSAEISARKIDVQ